MLVSRMELETLIDLQMPISSEGSKDLCAVVQVKLLLVMVIPQRLISCLKWPVGAWVRGKAGVQSKGGKCGA